MTGCMAGGCTASLDTRPDRYRTESDHAIEGVPYSLPMRQYSVSVARALTECPGPNPDGGAPLELKFGVEGKAETRLVAGENYLIDYLALQNVMTSSSLAIATHETSGTLKSINASADNQLDEVISAAAKTAFSIASVLLPVAPRQLLALPPSPLPADAPVLRLTCTDAARKLLTDVSGKAKAVKDATEELSLATDAVAKATRIGAQTRTERLNLYGLIETQQKKEQALQAAKKKLEEAKAEVSVSGAYIWPGDFGTTEQELPFNSEERKKLRDLVRVASDDESGTACEAGETIDGCVKRQVVTFVRLETITTPPEECTAESLVDPWSTCVDNAQGVEARSSGAAAGLFIRPPVDGRLVLCKEDKRCTAGEKRAVLVGETLPIPQLGQLRFLPFQTRAFQNRQLTLGLRADGTVEKFEFQSKAAGKRAAALAADLAAQLKAYDDARETEAEKKAKDARELAAAARAEELAELQQQITMMTKQNELKALLSPTPAAPDLMAQAQLELVRAQAELILAQAELARRGETPEP